MTLVKICGNTNEADALMAVRLGADYLGVIVEHPPSSRNVGIEDAARIAAAVAESEARLVAVTVNRTLGELLAIADALQRAARQAVALQLHGDESAQLVRDLKARGLTVWAACSGAGEASSASEAARRRAHEMTSAGADAVLVDARIANGSGIVYGGTGERSDWQLARALVEDGLRVILAGGLSPENASEAIAAVRPWMVDVISGVEAHKGVKDEEKVRRFIEAARGVFR